MRMTYHSKTRGFVGFLFLLFLAGLTFYWYKNYHSTALEVIWGTDKCTITTGPQEIIGVQKVEKISKDEWKFTCAVPDGRNASAVILTSESITKPGTYSASSTVVTQASTSPKTVRDAKIRIATDPKMVTTLTGSIPGTLDFSSLNLSSFFKKLKSLATPQASAH